MRNPKNTPGFTLIEVMIVVAIIGILGAIAYPSYRTYVLRSHRAEGKSLLLDAATRQERFFSDNTTYTNTVTTGGLGYGSDKTEHILYQLSVETPTGACPITSCYSLRATPLADRGQDQDTDCGYFTLNSLGQKGSQTGDTDCW